MSESPLAWPLRGSGDLYLHMPTEKTPPRHEVADGRAGTDADDANNVGRRDETPVLLGGKLGTKDPLLMRNDA